MGTEPGTIPARVVAGIVLDHMARTGETQTETARRIGIDEARLRLILHPTNQAKVSALLADKITTRLDRQDAWHGGELADYSADPPPRKHPHRTWTRTTTRQEATA